MILNVLFLIALTFPVAVASTAFSINNEQLSTNSLQFGQKLMFALILALGQGVMYTLGSLLGGTFMHMLGEYSQWVILVLCFAIYYRMFINTLKIKKGANLYFVQTKKQLLLLSIALGVNAFVAGLMEEFYQPFQNLTPYLLMAVAFVWALAEMLIPFSKMKLTINSLLNLILAFVIFAKGFWGLF